MLTLKLNKINLDLGQIRIVNFINKLLVITSAILFLSGCLLFFRGEKNIIFPIKTKYVLSLGGQTHIKKKAFSYYEAIFDRRIIFMAQPQTEKDRYRQSEPASDNADWDASQLQLTGVVKGKQGLQAIISNTKNEQTYFCPVGEKLGSFTIKEVLQNKVLLEKDGRTIELTL